MDNRVRMVIDIIKITKERPDLFTYLEQSLPGNEGHKRTWTLSIDGVNYYAAMNLAGKKVVDAYIAVRSSISTLTETELKKLHNRMKRDGKIWQP